MKVTRTFSVELNTEEVENITTALHELYKTLKDVNKNAEAISRTWELRNGFASLIGRAYMGVDA